MKKSIFSLSNRRYFIIGLGNVLLAIGFAIASFRYIRPVDCYRICDTTKGLPCPSGACTIGEQRAGWPLPVFVDDPGGGSPTSGWAMLGPEDPPLLGPFIVDALFYSFLLWLAFYIVELIRGQALPVRVTVATWPIITLLVACLWFIYFYLGPFGIDVDIGRGRRDSAQVDTPTATIYAEAFSPTVRIPLKEIVEEYGEPTYLRLDLAGTPETPLIGAALYWDSLRLSVEMPKIKGKVYDIERTAGVEKIIFFDVEQYSYLSAIPFGDEKRPWSGYGNYRP